MFYHNSVYIYILYIHIIYTYYIYILYIHIIYIWTHQNDLTKTALERWELEWANDPRPLVLIHGNGGLKLAVSNWTRVKGPFEF